MTTLLDDLRETYSNVEFVSAPLGLYKAIFKYSSLYFTDPPSASVLQTFEKEHNARSLENRFGHIFKHLSFHLMWEKSKSEWLVSVQTRQGETGGLNFRMKDDNEFNFTILANFDEEAEKAEKEDMFFCSGHMKAEPLADKYFYWFNGNFCKRYAEERPDTYRSAMRETYE